MKTAFEMDSLARQAGDVRIAAVGFEVPSADPSDPKQNIAKLAEIVQAIGEQVAELTRQALAT